MHVLHNDALRFKLYAQSVVNNYHANNYNKFFTQPFRSLQIFATMNIETMIALRCTNRLAFVA